MWSTLKNWLWNIVSPVGAVDPDPVYPVGMSDPSRVIIKAYGKYYDITDFIPYHPGGTQCLYKRQNEDCTSDMEMHSKRARKFMERYAIVPGSR